LVRFSKGADGFGLLWIFVGFHKNNKIADFIS